MMTNQQTFQNHARFHPIFHFVLAPIFFANFVIAVVLLVRAPGWPTAWQVIMAIALFFLLLLVRINPLRVQDRIIRLEERLRLATILPEPLRTRIPELSEKQLIALRFASDAEAPALVQKTLSENLGRSEIKKAITEWRADHWRV
ncbi:MAG TPA: DUF6526 family protein [Silvibacterium sp.]|nr:DUF6526 family protein [Silvibacterium sp.]